MNARVGKIFDRIAIPPKIVAVRSLLSFAVRTMRDTAHVIKIGKEAIHRQNQIHPIAPTESKIGNANVNPPAMMAAHPPTKQGNRALDLDTIISMPATTERNAKNVVIFEANDVGQERRGRARFSETASSASPAPTC